MAPDKTPEPEPVDQAADELVKGMVEVVTAALGVGAALARTTARATALGKTVPEPPGNNHPVNLIVHYSLATAMNVLGAVASGVGGVGAVLHRSPSAAQPAAETVETPPAAETTAAVQPTEQATATVESAPAQPSAGSMQGHPSVKQGNSLRIPLSIENPSEADLVDLRFVCLGVEAAAPVEAHSELPGLRCEPDSLNIAAHDFEKLTVYIDVPASTPPGVYSASLGLAGQAEEGTGNNFRSNIIFSVLPNAATPAA